MFQSFACVCEERERKKKRGKKKSESERRGEGKLQKERRRFSLSSLLDPLLTPFCFRHLPGMSSLLLLLFRLLAAISLDLLCLSIARTFLPRASPTVERRGRPRVKRHTKGRTPIGGTRFEPTPKFRRRMKTFLLFSWRCFSSIFSHAPSILCQQRDHRCHFCCS